jgi:hypothetical protein
MGCGGCGIGSLLDSKKGKKRNIVNNYIINDDHSVEIKDSVVHRSSVGSQIKICPYCGKKLSFVETPNFCPFCEKQLS